MARVITGLLALLGATLLAGCGIGDDEALDYRYRLTVEVETPEGLKTGSSVIEVTQKLVRPAMSPGNLGVERRTRGEAVTVDLPDGQVLFALLRSEANVDWSNIVMQRMAPKVSGEYAEQISAMSSIKGERVLPRYWKSPLSKEPPTPGYPMLVKFGDLDDPTSVERVDPDDLASSFGEGVRLRRITVELTDDPVTTGIEKKLGWLPNYYDKMLDGNQIRTIEATNRLANSLPLGAFSKGLLQ